MTDDPNSQRRRRDDRAPLAPHGARRPRHRPGDRHHHDDVGADAGPRHRPMGRGQRRVDQRARGPTSALGVPRGRVVRQRRCQRRPGVEAPGEPGRARRSARRRPAWTDDRRHRTDRCLEQVPVVVDGGESRRSRGGGQDPSRRHPRQRVDGRRNDRAQPGHRGAKCRRADRHSPGSPRPPPRRCRADHRAPVRRARQSPECGQGARLHLMVPLHRHRRDVRRGGLPRRRTAPPDAAIGRHLAGRRRPERSADPGRSASAHRSRPSSRTRRGSRWSSSSAR